MDWIRAYLVLREVCRQLHGIVPKHQSVQIYGIHSVNLMWILLCLLYHYYRVGGPSQFYIRRGFAGCSDSTRLENWVSQNDWSVSRLLVERESVWVYGGPCFVEISTEGRLEAGQIPSSAPCST